MEVVIGKRSRVKRRFCLKREGKRACLHVDGKDIVKSKMLMMQVRGQNY